MEQLAWIDAGSLKELQEKKTSVIRGGIAVFYHEGEVYAIDNRCPHMGFPLHKGSLCDGMLTCHWHHARFDIRSGGTLDPWADDVPVYEVKIENNRVKVNPKQKMKQNEEMLFQRLRNGLEQNISLVIAKAIVQLVKAGVPDDQIVAIGLEFGTTNRQSGWGPGLTILTAMANILPKLDEYGRMLALFKGMRHVASDSAGQAPRFPLNALPKTELKFDRLVTWYRQCVEVRDTDGAERILLTAIQQGVDLDLLMEMMMTAVTDHVYLDGGHTLDFHNKAFEALKFVDGQRTERILSSVVPMLQNPSRSEENHNWNHPVNLVEPLMEEFAKLEQREGSWKDNHSNESFDEREFVDLVLSDRPELTVKKLTEHLLHGVSAVRLARLITLAAAERIARFHTQNDFSDWDAVLHTYTHAHAVHKSLLRRPNYAVIKGLYHTVMRIYLDRFLNIPAAKKPDEKQLLRKKKYTLDLTELLSIMDHRQNVEEAANWVYLYMNQNGNMDELFHTLIHSLLREDAGFHTYQMLEAALVEYDLWEQSNSPMVKEAQKTTIYALTRYLAAHSPTSREQSHVARIAWRLQHGEALFDE